MKNNLLLSLLLVGALYPAQEIDFSTPTVNTYGVSPTQGMTMHGESESMRMGREAMESSKSPYTTENVSSPAELKSFREIYDETPSVDLQQDIQQKEVTQIAEPIQNTQIAQSKQTPGMEYDPSLSTADNQPTTQVIVDREDYYDRQKDGSYIRKGHKDYNDYLPIIIICAIIGIVLTVVLTKKNKK